MPSVWEIGAAVVAVAIVYVLVRPQSKGAVLVGAIGDLFSATVLAVTTGTNKGA
jgi:hypothetical protein